MKELIPVYFPTVNETIPISMRFFDRLLHAGMLVCINKRWIELH